MTGWKKSIKRIAQQLAAAGGRHRWRARRPSLLVLTYHRVLPAAHPDMAFMQPGMVVTPETLRLHMRVLKEFFELVDLNDWAERVRSGRPVPLKACALTFDDGWRDNYEFAFPILRDEAAPATIFVVSDMVGTEKGFWPERLARALQRWASLPPGDCEREPAFTWLRELVSATRVNGACDRDVIDAAIVRAKQHTDDEIERRLAEIERHWHAAPAESVPRDMVSWEELREMQASGVFSVGSHTRRHRRMQEGLAPGIVQDEILGSGTVLRERLGVETRLFCYPNGDWTTAAEHVVRERYQAACLTKPGWNFIGDDVYRLRRINMHNDMTRDRTAFLARISGWV